MIYGMVQCFVFLSFLPPLMKFGLVPPMPDGIRVLGVEHPKNLIVQGRKATGPNSFSLDVFLFTTSFLNILTSLHLNEFVFLTHFSPFL